MPRALLCLAIVAVQLAARQEACCRPPDEVAYSLIPPLKQPLHRRSTRVARVGLVPTGTGRIHERVWSPIPPAASATSFDVNMRPRATPSPQRDSSSANVEDDSATNHSAEQLEIWNSPEMLEARNAVLEFCRRSGQTSPAEGQQFLARLSQLSPEEMRLWLERFRTRRMHVSRGREVERKARQLTVEYTIRRQEEMRRAAANIADLRREAAESTREQFPPMPQLEATRYLPYEDASSIGLSRSYDPFDAVTDPSSPRGYARRVAAAMSLPGDLPRSDPRNFIRDLEGVDFDELAATRDAEPPTTPVTPVNDSAVVQ